MPLIPEKLNTRQEVRNAIASQFWDQPVQSGRSIDGTARLHACEPPPAGQTAAGGLMRSQELLITQAAGLPVMPGFSEDNGGVVLDRVLAKVGGKRWWANLTGRAKGQQMWNAHRDGSKVGDALKDLNSYGLNARTHFVLGRNTSVNAVVEAPNVHDLRDSAKGLSDGDTKTSQAAYSQPALKSQAWIKHQLPGHDLVGTAACNQDYLDSAANYSTVPLSLSLDLASKDRPDGIQYRAGVHQVSAPEVDSARFHSFGEAMPSDSTQWRTSLHAQGAVAVEGEAHLWRPGKRATATPAPASAFASDSAKHASEDGSKAQVLQEAHSSHQGSSANSKAEPSAVSPPSTTGSEPIHPQKQITDQAEPPLTSSSSSTANSSTCTASAASPGQPSTSTADALSRNDQSQAAPPQPVDSSAVSPTATAMSPASNAARHQTSATSLPQHPWPLVRHKRPDGSEGVLLDNYSTVVSDSDSSGNELQPAPQSLLRGISAKQIQSSVSQAQSNVGKLRQVLDAVNTGIQEGRAQQQQQLQLALSRQSRPVPYSPWLSQPFLKVNGAVGCLARMPLPQSALWPRQNTSNMTSSSSMTSEMQPSRTSSRFGSELWTPYLRDTGLRVFGSVGVSGQLGHFSRKALDFTAGSVRLDFGLTSPHQASSTAAASSYGNLSVFNPRDDHLDAPEHFEPTASQPLASTRFKNRAFALEGRGIWHALSASVTQQVIGPVRARADFRYALDLPSSIPQGPDGKRGWHNILEAAGQIKPTQLESVYGLDVIVPGTRGVARAAVWYSPTRKETRIELKLF